MEKREILRNLGFEEDDMDMGNVGFEIEDMEGYFARECAENRLEQGLPVPEEFIPDQRGQDEKDLWRRTKEMERLELERCHEDKSQSWPWTDRDERAWYQELADNGYHIEPDGVVGSVKQSEDGKTRISRLLAQGVKKLSTKR